MKLAIHTYQDECVLWDLERDEQVMSGSFSDCQAFKERLKLAHSTLGSVGLDELVEFADGDEITDFLELKRLRMAGEISREDYEIAKSCLYLGLDGR